MDADPIVVAGGAQAETPPPDRFHWLRLVPWKPILLTGLVLVMLFALGFVFGPNFWRF